MRRPTSRRPSVCGDHARRRPARLLSSVISLGCLTLVPAAIAGDGPASTPVAPFSAAGVDAGAPDEPRWLKRILGSRDDSLGTQKTIDGLKEALRVGSDNAVSLTGREDGFFGNEAIRILMPEKLQKLEKGLRMVGFDEQLDEFVLSMNRAAEQAAPQAKEIFWGAVKEMTFDDARKILEGHDTAATEYFREATSEELTASFTPIVRDAMQGVGVKEKYEALVGRYAKIPFTSAPSLDIDEYVVTKALEGLFHVLGEQERKIRTDPAARVTELLKDVFGKR